MMGGSIMKMMRCKIENKYRYTLKINRSVIKCLK